MHFCVFDYVRSILVQHASIVLQCNPDVTFHCVILCWINLSWVLSPESWVLSPESWVLRPESWVEVIERIVDSCCYYHHQIGSINLTHCYHIFPWLCAWDVCYIMFCHLFHMHSGKPGILFSLLLCSLWWVQIVGYVLACRSYSVACT